MATMNKVRVFSKQEIIDKLKKISEMGWIENRRRGNQGGVGNTLEDLLGVEENNLPIPNASEWELKTQRLGTSALTTLLHSEPSPRAVGFVSQVLLPNYGWEPNREFIDYPKGELSFRQTINGMSRTDRGFMVEINRKERKITISFDAKTVDVHHSRWLKSVAERTGLGELNPQPYWGFDDLEHKAGIKLPNCFYVQAEVKRKNRNEFYKYSKVLMLQKFNFENFLKGIEEAKVLIDFDARSGHNHGAKVRLRQNSLPLLYKKATTIV